MIGIYCWENKINGKIFMKIRRVYEEDITLYYGWCWL